MQLTWQVNSSTASFFPLYLLCLEPAIYIFRHISPNKSSGYTFHQKCDLNHSIVKCPEELAKREGDLYKPSNDFLIQYLWASVEVSSECDDQSLGKIPN